MSLLATLGFIGTGLGALGNTISAFGGKSGQAIASIGNSLTQGAGTVSAIQGSEQQAALSREVYEYQKNLQNRIFEREDNAVQRRVKDLEAAGLSRTLAAGSSANAGTPISVSTPQSESSLRGQALFQGVQNMLNIAQAKANIALTEANARKANAEADINEYDLGWFDDAGLPTGSRSGIAFLVNSIATNLGVSNKQAVSFVTGLITKLAKRFGIDLEEMAADFGQFLNEDPSSVNAIVKGAGKSVSVGITNHGDFDISLLSGSDSDSGDPDAPNLDNAIERWWYNRKLKKEGREWLKNHSSGRGVNYITSNGGYAW